MKYLTVTNARASFLRLVDDLAERIAIMRNGQPVAVLLDFDDYRALCAAQAFTRDPERLAEIQAVAHRVRAGDLSGFEAVPAVTKGQPRRAVYTAPPPLDLEHLLRAERQPSDRDDVGAVADAPAGNQDVVAFGSQDRDIAEQIAELQEQLAEVRDRVKSELANLYKIERSHAALHECVQPGATVGVVFRNSPYKRSEEGFGTTIPTHDEGVERGTTIDAATERPSPAPTREGHVANTRRNG